MRSARREIKDRAKRRGSHRGAARNAAEFTNRAADAASSRFSQPVIAAK
jgi:hypothetical protein